MASRYEIAAEFTLIDKATKPLGKFSSFGTAVSAGLQGQMLKAEERIRAFGAKVAAVPKVAAGVAVGAVTAGIGVATKQFIEFDSALHTAGSVSDEYAKKMDELGLAARKVAAATEFDAVQSANALATMARAGIESNGAIKMLSGMADLATSAGVQLDEAVNMGVGALNVFKMNTGDLGGNLKRISDMMQVTANSANMTLLDVSEAVKVGGANFTSPNQSISTFLAGLDALASKGIAGSEAGRVMKNAFLNLSAPVKQAQDSLAALGIRTKDSRGNLLNLTDIIGQFERSIAGMGSADAAEHLKNIFGKENYTGIVDLIDVGAAGLRNYTAAIENSEGAAAKAAETARQSLGNMIEVLKSSLTELGFTFVSAFQKKGAGALQKITQAVSNFTESGGVEKITDAVMKAGAVFAKAAKNIWAFRKPIMATVVAAVAFRAAMTATYIALKAYKTGVFLAQAAQLAYGITVHGSAWAQNVFTLSSNAMKVATLGMAGAIKVATGVQWLFNAALAANPIGLIILGVVAAVAALTAIVVAVVKHWDVVSAAIGRFVSWIKGAFSAIGRVFQAVGSFFARLTKGFFTFLIGAKNVEIIANAFRQFGELIGGFITEKLSQFSEWISGIFTPLWTGILKGLSAAGDFFSNIFTPILEGVKWAFGVMIDYIIGKWQTLTAAFTNGGILGALINIGGNLFAWVLSPIQTLLNLISKIPGVGNITAGIADGFQQFRRGLEGLAAGDAAPTRTAVQAASVSREESVTTSNVALSLPPGMTAQTAGLPPGVTIQRSRSGAF